ncbi:MAG: transcription-repair coupling factor [Chlamydiae bacterium]|nr:transcription-repair coupling factor [Chlamydiota bacterium]
MWSDLSTRLLSSNAILKLQEALRKKTSLLLEGLWDAPKAFLASFALQETKRSILLITGASREDRLFEDLSQFAPGDVLEFPPWETLPGEEIAPSSDIIGKRFETLNLLKGRRAPCIVLCPLAALLQKIAAPEETHALCWKKGTKLSFASLSNLLTDLGYKRTAVVSDKGEFAIRGGILDVFPTAAQDPYRIEFFDDEIDQIRIFDPVGQKSIQKVESIFLCWANERSLLQKTKKLVSILEYLGEDPILMWDDLLAIEDAYVALKNMPAAKSPWIASLEEICKHLKNTEHFFCTEKPIETLSEIKKTKQHTLLFEAFGQSFEALRLHHFFQRVSGYFSPEETEITSFFEYFRPESNLSLLFLTASDIEKQTLKSHLKSIKLPLDTSFSSGSLSSGFVLADIPLALISYSEISHKKHIRRQKWRNTYHTPAAEFHELTPGDLVVHFHSGIGKYLGVEKQIDHLGKENEFLAIEYAEQSKLFVPLSQTYLVSRYIGSKEELPTLSTLGSKRWQTAKANAQAQIVGYANELLQLYAARSVEGGFRYPRDSEMMSQFERDFPYTETEDQTRAIEALKLDMMSDRPMDRLICGDVGYGKTEVAMRAAFKAVVDGKKQVALLVPTTVLAMQHFETFSERMEGFPIKVEVVSRFRSPKEIKEILTKTKEGKVDILIGTHRLLSEDVSFQDLGLLIVDEEQRFGVKAKEHLKQFKTNIDCLTMSATPIPRTLYMSLVEARDMSVIATPPQDRLPIKTIIAEMDMDLVQSALLREFSRGGGAFYIHNRVESIYERASLVQKLTPSARIGVIHGQMASDEVDLIIHKFRHGDLNLLFATTIVENGIDVPNANTILIERSDTYGLGDLYQLRGRVGRWNRAAYAYFLIPKRASLSQAAHKRLHALVESSGYGGGMKLAMRDLEIRGAGDILGIEQSGFVSAIGFHLYCKLLKRAIEALKHKKPISFNDTKMEHSYDARLPEHYIEEPSVRMEIYYRLGDALSLEELDDLLSELNDRFGAPPPAALWLYHLTRIRTFAAQNHFTLLKFGALSLSIELQKGKEMQTRTILLPKKVHSPRDMETYVTEELKKIAANF